MDLKQLCQKAAGGDQTALSDLKILAEGGDSDGLFYLGFLYDESSGTEVSKDSVAARQYYLQAATLGHRLAQLSIGNMCDYGEGGVVDLEAARHWYSAAAHQEVRAAQMHYGRMLETGRGGPIDIAEAAIWYSRAVEQGDEFAATNLALMHLNGLLNESDVQFGIRLLQYSAEMLDGVAHLQLGHLCDEGKIVQQNPEIALFHYCVAAVLLPGNKNYDQAITRKERILRKLPDRKSAVESKALAYVAKHNGRLPA